MNQRQQVLQALVTFSQPLDILTQALNQFEWDYEGKPVIIEPFHLVSVLNRFLSHQLEASQIEKWANLIECREDLDYEAANQEQLEQVIYELANPEIEGPLTIERCQQIFLRFSLPHTLNHDYVRQMGFALEKLLNKYKTHDVFIPKPSLS
jgi:hypothetical protein